MIYTDYLEMESDEIPTDLYLDETVEANNLKNIFREIDSTIWFISLLTRVDGLVLMTPNLEVQGFGVEITCTNEPTKILLAKNEEATQVQEINYNHFGTRHRSMMRYCSKVDNSVGFVISQDGDVRVMTKVDEHLIMWENIRLQLDFKLSKK